MSIARILAQLMRPLPASLVKQRDGHEIRDRNRQSYDPKRYFQLSYVEWHTKWMSVLAAAPDASWEVVRWEGSEAGFIVQGRLTIEGVARDGMGWAATKMAGQKPNAVDIGIKDAETDALARCCVKFGSGIALYGVSDKIIEAFARLHGEDNGRGQDDPGEDPEPERYSHTPGPPTSPRTSQEPGPRPRTETPSEAAMRMSHETPPDDGDDRGQMKIEEAGLIHPLVGAAILDKIDSGERQALRAAEYDLRARLAKSLPIALARLHEATGERMSSNALEGHLRQGHGQGVDLSPASLKFLVHLLVVAPEWAPGMMSSVSSYWIDVKAGVSA
jgi:hypothetical protein